MRRVGVVFYPILFAVSLVIGVAARGVGKFRGADLALVTGAVALVTAAACVAVLVLVRLLDRSGRGARLAPPLTMILVAWFFFYVPAQHAVEAFTWRFSRDSVLLPLGALATGVALVVLLRQSISRLADLNAFMTRFGFVLLVIVTLGLVVEPGVPSALKHSVLVKQLAEPIPVVPRSGGAGGRSKPDIYLIVLDGHANARVLNEVLRFDNSEFEDSLRTLGFVIPPDMRSNYAQTILSLPSLLNATHVTQLAEDAGATNPSYALPRYLLENNRVARFLKAQGYKYVLFPSSWWTPTQHSPIADVEFDARPEFSVANAMRRTELRQAVFGSTMLRSLSATGIDTLFDIRSMAGLRAMPADTAPTFVFAHVLLPHMPYYLDEHCRTLAQPIMPEAQDSSEEQRLARVAQIKCVDRMVLDVVTTLLRDSETAPVILLVGDHGSRFTDPNFLERPHAVSPSFIRERFGALGAFHLPGGGERAFTEPVTLVNVMANVLRHYFDADLPQNRNDMYVSGALPFRYFRVDTTGYIGSPPGD